MSRAKRVISESGYYHIYTRGNGKQILFENRNDYIYYLTLLRKYSAETKIVVHAFCLMENHVHLIICETKFLCL